MFNLSDSLPNVQLLLSPVTCAGKDIDILSVVHSAVENLEAREAIRASWGAPKGEYGIVTKLVFILGVSHNASHQGMLEAESLLYGDIVQGDFIDAYRNLSYKNLLGLQWVSHYCTEAKIIVKTDDDYFIDIYAIHHLSNDFLANPRFQDGSLLACPMLTNNIVFRDLNNKETGRWVISQEELPSSRLQKWHRRESNNDNYPPYCTGWNNLSNRHHAYSDF